MPTWATNSFTTAAAPLTFRNGTDCGYYFDGGYVDLNPNVGVYLDSDIDSKIKRYLKKAIGETLRELKMNVTEEEFFRILEEKADV